MSARAQGKCGVCAEETGFVEVGSAFTGQRGIDGGGLVAIAGTAGVSAAGSVFGRI